MTIQTAGRIFAPSLSSFLTTRRPFADANVPRHCYPDDAAGPYDTEHLFAHKPPKRQLLCKQARPSTPRWKDLTVWTNPRSCATLCALMRLYATLCLLHDLALEEMSFGSEPTMQARRIQAAVKSGRACQRDMLGRCIVTRCMGACAVVRSCANSQCGALLPAPPRNAITVRSFYAGKECCWSQASCPPYRCRSRLPGR